jgi:uncharacterized membrane protein
LLRWPARGITIALQSSPILLTLVIAAAILHALVPYSSTVALGAAIGALGLSNGSNAAQAISEAYMTLRAERVEMSVDGRGFVFPRRRPVGDTDCGVSDQRRQGQPDR